MIRIILITIYAFYFSDVSAQINTKLNDNKIDLSFIQNGKMKYSFVMLSCDTCVPISNLGIRVRVELSDEKKLLLKKISHEEWFNLLNDKKSDFIANVILYELYSKNAIDLLVIEDIEKWRKFVKKDDLEYWYGQLME